MKKIALKTLPLLCLTLAALSACDKPKVAPRPDHAAELRAAGYTGAPVITAVSQPSPGTVVVTGKALPDGRVRFLYGQDRAVGVTADSQGRFSAELPISGAGGLYDLSMEDSGALLHAEGRLFVPAGQPAKAVLLRPGSPAAPLTPPGLGIVVVDYDSAGALGVVGRVAPRAGINLVVDSEVRAQPISDPNGMYSAVTQIAPPTDNKAMVTVSAEAAGAEWKRAVPVSKPAADQDAVTAIDGGWRVDWRMPGGGVQTTLVF
ncbi:hypothetical protein [Asticcacaulis solisilvae]|uniref:hypothetical protein n=1 Tax=Asticcacaulis solisilvae TaxID=1217274 RepID=UPI003FD7B569